MDAHQRPGIGPDNAKDLWFLGAGFSKCLYEGMPLMTELADNVADILTGRFTNTLLLNHIELALSELGSDAPWKSPADKYRDLMLFEMVMERIKGLLDVSYERWGQDTEGARLGRRLVNTWHIDRTHVLTTNYDMLVETLLDSLRWEVFREQIGENNHYLQCPSVYPIPIPSVRTRDGTPWRSTGRDIFTFSYYKLHGSLNYYTHKYPFQNNTLYYKEPTEEEDLAEGLQPFIVPPTNNKQTFIEHPTLHAIWNKAASQIANIDKGRIIFIGYSMPDTDATMASMIRSAIRSSPSDGVTLPTILVVNPDPNAARHYKEFLGLPNPIGKITDVKTFLDLYAPEDFVRVHVWDNKSLADHNRMHQEYLKIGGTNASAQALGEHARWCFQFRDELRQKGNLGWEWFQSWEEFVNWHTSIHKDIPVEEWL